MGKVMSRAQRPRPSPQAIARLASNRRPTAWGGLLVVTARRAGYLLTSVLLAVAGAGVAGGLVIAGGLLSVVLVGVPILLAGLLLGRTVARLERGRVRLVLGVRIPSLYRAPPTTEGPHLTALPSDPASWRDLLYLALLLPLSVVHATVGAVAVGVPLVMATLWTWTWALPDGEVAIGGLSLESWPRLLATAALAVPTALLGAVLVTVVAVPHGAVARSLLSPGRVAQLSRRVDDLTAARAGSLAV